MRRRVDLAASVAVALFTCTAAYAQQGDGTEVQITTNVFKPNKVAPTSERIGQLKAPDGFSVQPFAQGLGNSRIVAEYGVDALTDNLTKYRSKRDFKQTRAKRRDRGQCV